MISQLVYEVKSAFSQDEMRSLIKLAKHMYSILPESYSHELTSEVLPMKDSFKVTMDLDNKVFKFDPKDKELFSFEVATADSETEMVVPEVEAVALDVSKKQYFEVALPYQNTSFLIRNFVLLAKYVNPNKIEILEMFNPTANKVFCSMVVDSLIKELEEAEVDHEFERL